MDKYLLQILLDVNTIIIPGLGALTVTNPKTREMMFMSYLKYDDGKLAAYISEKEGMSENDAKNLIAKYVRDIQTKLDQGHTYDMFEFGRFLKNKDGDIDFEGWGAYNVGIESTEVSSSESVLIADEVLETLPESGVIAEEEAYSEPEETKKITPIIPVIAEEEIEAEPISPDEEPEVNADETIREQKEEVIVPESATISDFRETVEPAREEENDSIEDLTVLPVNQSSSLDEILEKSEEKQNEKPVETTVNVTPIALPTQDEEKVQVENIYIPPVEMKPEPAKVPEKPQPKKEQPGKVEKKAVTEEQPKKKRGAGFWILISLIALILIGGIVSVIFYDSVKAYLPFMENKRVEATKDTVNQDSIDKLNESAEELEAAENERITGAPQDGTEVSETLTEPVEEKIAEVVEKPAPPVQAASQGSGDKNYHVIGGAFSEKSNADRYAEKLKAGGNNSVIVGRFDNLYLVSIDSYSSKAEAQNALNGFESITGKAWVFKWP